MAAQSKPTLRSDGSLASLVLSNLVLSVLIALLAIGVLGLRNVNLKGMSRWAGERAKGHMTIRTARTISKRYALL